LPQSQERGVRRCHKTMKPFALTRYAALYPFGSQYT
jgi:hypothetical protein